MAIEKGTYRLGPADSALSVRTGRSGAAAKAGHDLLLEVRSWEATLVLADDPAETKADLGADGGSLRVIKGTGGMQALGEEDMENIVQTIDDEVLKRENISFHSTGAKGGAGGSIILSGDLSILGRSEPIEFELTIGEDGSLGASAGVTQTAWGIKPYSALFGALKVSDEVEVILVGHL